MMMNENNDNIMIKNKTLYDKHAIMILHTIHSKRHVTLFVISMALLIYLIIDTTIRQPEGSSNFLVLYVVLGLFLIVSSVYVFIINKKRMLRQAEQTRLELYYTFEKDNFTLTIEGEQGKQEQSFAYKSIKKALETDTHYFMYVSRNMALVVDKSGFEVDEAKKQFHEYLKTQRVKLRRVRMNTKDM